MTSQDTPENRQTQENSKKCSKCGEIKSIKEFNKNKTKSDGFDIYCKICCILKSKLYRENNPTYCKDYNNQHRIKRNKQSKEWKQQNPEKAIAQKIRFKNNNPNYFREYNKKHHKMFPEMDRNRGIRFRKNNPDYINNYQKRRKMLDPVYKLAHNLRASLKRFLGGMKTIKTEALICCTYKELWNHLEKQFRDGMTRENHGKVWHVDHRIPLQWFKDNDLMDETNQKIAWHYGNLQPLLVKENLSKSNTMPINPNFKY